MINENGTETRDIVCPYSGVKLGEVTFPVNTPEEKWTAALSGYISSDVLTLERHRLKVLNDEREKLLAQRAEDDAILNSGNE